MPRGQRTLRIPEKDIEQKKWQKLLDDARKHVVDTETGRLKRPQIDTWAAIDEWGFTPEEFRLLYCLARHENWKSVPGGQKERVNGCFASTDTLNRLTGISRKKIFEILDLFQRANIVGQPKPRGRKQEGQENTRAGWTNEYEIQAIDKWAPPWELAQLRKMPPQGRSKKEATSTQDSSN